MSRLPGFIRAADIAALTEPKTVLLDLRDEKLLDVMDIAYKAEHARWVWRRITTPIGERDRFELVRDSSPNGDIIAEEYQEIVKLTKRQCSNSESAEEWLDAFVGRAAMRAALEALRDA